MYNPAITQLSIFRVSEEKKKNEEAASFLYTLIELLNERGELSVEDLMSVKSRWRRG